MADCVWDVKNALFQYARLGNERIILICVVVISKSKLRFKGGF